MNDQTTPRRKRAARTAQNPAVSTNPDALLTLPTVAELIGCKPDTVRKWVATGRFPVPIRLGRSVRWRAKTVNDWMQLQAAISSSGAGSATMRAA